jgi:fucose permease
MYATLGYFAYFQAGVGALMPFLRADLDLSFTAGSLHFVAFSTGVVVAGSSGDRVLMWLGRRRTFWCSGSLAATGIILLGVGNHLAVTLAGCLIMGLAGAQLMMTIQASLSAHYRDLRAVAIAESNVMASACAIFSPILIGAAEKMGLGWQSGILLAAAAMAALFLLGRRIEFPEAETKPTRAARGGGRESPLPLVFWAYGAALFLGTAVEWSIIYWGASFLEQVVGLERALAATCVSLFFIAMLIGRVAMSALARWFAAQKLMVATFALAVIGFPLFWLAPGVVPSLFGLFVSGLGVANIYPLVVTNAIGAAGERTDTAVARLAVIGGGATLSVPFVLGMAADGFGLSVAYALPALLLVLGLLAGVWANALTARKTRTG